ncbi:MAG: FG-GAP-like repeat-containing protein, partial [Chthonomonadaceae bacterium]|nr:FG-GAP-like repeat-containing protein [Chthonomonadaceae bacterium]
TGDLNGDGAPDMVVTARTGTALVVLLGTGDARFLPPVSYPTGGMPSGVILADMDLDGTLDVVVANRADDTVSILPGRGDGTLLPQRVFPVGSKPVAVAPVDCTQDRKPDLCIVHSGGNDVGVLVNASGVVEALTPGSIAAGAARDFQITLQGSGFAPVAVVRWNETDLPTTYISAQEIRAMVSASLVTRPGVAHVRLRNPETGLMSNALAFRVTDDAASTGALSGTITLQSIAPTAAPVPVTFTLRPNGGGNAITRTVPIGPDGRFTIASLPAGRYHLRIKGTRYLASSQTVEILPGHTLQIRALLAAGDVDGDNRIDVQDLQRLIAAFDAAASEAHFDPDADLNGDGSVDIQDLDLLMRNFDQVGTD